MIEILEKLQKSRTSKLDYPCLFDDTNIQSIYGMLDPTQRGYITVQQYSEGLYDIYYDLKFFTLVFVVNNKQNICMLVTILSWFIFVI